MNINKMILKAEKLYDGIPKANLNKTAGMLWADYIAGEYRNRDEAVKALAEIYVLGLGLRNARPELGDHWMGVAQTLSQDIIEDPEEFYDNIVRTLDDKNN